MCCLFAKMSVTENLAIHKKNRLNKQNFSECVLQVAELEVASIFNYTNEMLFVIIDIR